MHHGVYNTSFQRKSSRCELLCKGHIDRSASHTQMNSNIEATTTVLQLQRSKRLCKSSQGTLKTPYNAHTSGPSTPTRLKGAVMLYHLVVTTRSTKAPGYSCSPTSNWQNSKPEQGSHTTWIKTHPQHIAKQASRSQASQA